MNKERLVIVIDRLGRGGAEVLIDGILPALNKKYNVLLVTLFESEKNFDDSSFVCEKKLVLGFTSKFSLPSCILKLRRIIKDYQVTLVHAHLFYSSLIARLATPKNIPLIYSLHNEMSKDIFNNNVIARFLEKNTIKKNHFALAVSDAVLVDYENIFGKQPRAIVLKNFINDEYYVAPKIRNFEDVTSFKMVAVANIKRSKNYEYLIEAFKYLKDEKVSLDIYGGGSSEKIAELQQEIDAHQLSVQFKGLHPYINEVLPKYDIYISSSIFEGFGLSVIEGMANGLPLLLSDIKIFHEVTEGNALFFDLTNPQSLVDLIKKLLSDNQQLRLLSEKGLNIAEKYNKKEYLEKLFIIYDDVISTV